MDRDGSRREGHVREYYSMQDRSSQSAQRKRAKCPLFQSHLLPAKSDAKDPRTYGPARGNNPIRTVSQFKLLYYSCNSTAWCVNEPLCKTLTLTNLPSNRTHTAASTAALLEDMLGTTSCTSSIDRIDAQADRARVYFLTGHDAWECARLLRLKAKDVPFQFCFDSKGELFNKRKEERHESVASARHNPVLRPKEASPTRPQLGCNRLVACLTISFSEMERSFSGHSRDGSDPWAFNILDKVFAVDRFPSLRHIQAGRSSWHVHFGREFDVVEADRMLAHELDERDRERTSSSRNSVRRYIRRWSLLKDGDDWRPPQRRIETERNEQPRYYEPSIRPPTLLPPPLVDTPTKDKTASASGLKQSDEELTRVKALRLSISSETAIFMPDLSSDSSDLPASVSGAGTPPAKRAKAQQKTPTASAPSKKENLPHESGNVSDEPTQPSEPMCSSGCARTEGLFRLPAGVKEKIRFPGTLEALSMPLTKGQAATTSDLRSSRAQNRSFGGAVPSSVMDFFRVSLLQAAQKTVALQSSSIHAFGLVLAEPAETGDLIIEYVGELVRSSVANVRELQYERDHHGDGIASSYLFRLDDMMVIDATSRGNLARFINHSCDPNCIAKTMSLSGSKRIVMYAKRPIRSGEELTYDYKFPTEKDPKKKIRCLCGQSNCRKYLN